MNIIAKIKRIVFTAKDTGFSILSLESSGVDGGSFSASGHAMFDKSPVGQVFNFTGEWGNHAKYGRQFNFTNYEPEGGDLYHFLAHVVKGLGPTLAKIVIDKFGDHTSWIIENDSAQLLQIKGIGQKKLDKVTESWHKYAGIRQLSSLLTPYGVTSNLIIRIFNAFEDRAAAMIKANPYCLSDIHGIGFKKADTIALAMGIPENSPTRVQECIKYVLKERAENQGDTVLSEEDIAARVLEETSGENGHNLEADKVYEALGWMEAQNIVHRMAGGYSLQWYHQQEKQIYDMLKRRQSLPIIPIIPPDKIDSLIAQEEAAMKITLADEQRDAVRMAVSGNRNMVVCGYAGSGKTTVSRIILRILARVFGEDAIICMALSGIAADRVRKVSGFAGGTIHATLGYGGGGDGGNAFKYGAGNLLPYDVVLLDESSMVNSYLFNKILSALAPNTIFIMLGDPAQLPPIGAGDPFNDIINLGLCPVGRLTKIYRQSDDSVLVEFANEIRKGIVPACYGV